MVTKIASKRKCRNHPTSARETPTLLLMGAVTWAPSTPEAGNRFFLGDHCRQKEKCRIALKEATNPTFFPQRMAMLVVHVADKAA